MNDYWNIPRASLTPSSASSAASSASSTQRSNRSQNKEILTPTQYGGGEKHQQTGVPFIGVGEGRRYSETSATISAAATAAAATAVLAAAPKRGSRSSQSSKDSTSSAVSSSLLLTAENLELNTEFHKSQYQQQQLQTHHLISSIYKPDAYQVSKGRGKGNQITDLEGRVHQHLDAVINIDPNLNFIKTQDFDTVSTASSMHFTMVNGETGENKKAKKGLCDRGRQVTVLILTMSTIFLLLIIAMVYALEMRAREMPQS